MWLDDIFTRCGVQGAFGRDCVLAAFWALCSVAILIPLLGPLAEAVGIRFSGAEQAVVLGIVVVQALLLCLRRVAPALCLVLVALVQLALVAVLPPDVTVRVAAPIVAAYTAGMRLPPDRLARAIGAAVLLEVIGGAVVAVAITPGVQSLLGGGSFLIDPATPSWATIAGSALDDLFVLLLYVSAALIGLFVALRHQQLRWIEARAADEIAAQGARADAVIHAERARMARELHDIAAHHLSGLVVQASAVERLIDRDPEAAKEATRSIRSQGKETLDNLRLAVGVLRERERAVSGPTISGRESGGAPSEKSAPVPGLAVLDLLVATARELGDRIELSVSGIPYELPPIADVTAYRVTQEALANARQHAPGASVRVSVAHGDRGTELNIMNDRGASAVEGAPTRRGFGLIGMRERADLAGATLDAGASGSGGWRVALSIPRHSGQMRSPPRTADAP